MTWDALMVLGIGLAVAGGVLWFVAAILPAFQRDVRSGRFS